MSASRLDALLKFLEDDPDDIFTHYAIGLEYVSTGQTGKAVEKMREVLRRDPGYVPAYQQLGSLLHQAGAAGEARKILREGADVASRSGDQHARNEMEDLLDELEGGGE